MKIHSDSSSHIDNFWCQSTSSTFYRSGMGYTHGTWVFLAFPEELKVDTYSHTNSDKYPLLTTSGW